MEQLANGGIKDESGHPLAVYSVNTPLGCYFAEDIARAALLIRANTLAKGFSGIRPGVIDSPIQVLNADLYPAVPEKGSVGASGDLAPLSHLVLVISKPPCGLDCDEESGKVLIPFDPQMHRPEECVVLAGPNG